jgi:hypothetical protein
LWSPGRFSVALSRFISFGHSFAMIITDRIYSSSS